MGPEDHFHYEIRDYYYCLSTKIPQSQLHSPKFRIGEWYGWKLLQPYTVGPLKSVNASNKPASVVEVAGIQVDCNKYLALQHNAAMVKDKHQMLPKLVVVTTIVNRQPVHALLDLGSLGNFMSSILADQLKVKHEEMEIPLTLQLAVQGLHSKVNSCTTVCLEYQTIKEDCSFDIANVNSYNLILGTP